MNDLLGNRPETLTTSDVMLASGVSFRRLDYWARRGLLRPDVVAPGSGAQRRWPPREAAIARAIARLHDDVGLTLDCAAGIARKGVDATGPVASPVARGVVVVCYPSLWQPEPENPAPPPRQETP